MGLNVPAAGRRAGHRSLVVVAAWTLLVWASDVQAATWYVATNGNDNNAGNTTASQLATLARAATKAGPGDTIAIRGGTYSWAASQYVGCNGTAAARITIQNHNGEAVYLQGNNMPAGAHVVRLIGNYLTFRGITVRNSKALGIDVGGHDVTVRDCTVHGNTWAGLQVGTWQNRGVTYSVTVDNVTAYDNARQNATRNGSSWPTGMAALFADGVVFKNCRSYRNYGEGIGLFLTNGSYVQNCKAYDNFSVGIYLDNATNCVVENNFVYHTANAGYYRDNLPATGIQVANESSYAPATNPSRFNTIRNNIVKGGAHAFFYGSYNNGGGFHDSKIYHNTMYATHGIVIQFANDAHSQSSVANNIFIQAKANETVGYYEGGSFYFFNNSWSGGNNWTNMNGAGDVWGNPQLTNPGTGTDTDYKLKSTSPCINRGSSPVVTNDYWWKTRSGTYDLGAHEF